MVRKAPEISVIMLTCNRENFVGRAIDSVLSQTFSDFEFIIIDNGSIDNSGYICEQYSQQDSRIRVFHVGSGNIGSRRNIGLYLARGEYIAYIDDDDHCEPDFLEFLLRLTKNYDADIAVCGSEKEENGQFFPNIAYNELHVMNKYKAVEAYLWRKLYNAAMPTKLIRKKLFDSICFFNTGNFDDITTTYRFFVQASRIAAYGIPKYTFHRHPGNNSRAATSDDMLTNSQLCEYLWAFKERTAYINHFIPELCQLARYSEWSYMISMIHKILTNRLKDCFEVLITMSYELNQNFYDFYNSAFIQEFEKAWLIKHILREKQVCI